MHAETEQPKSGAKGVIHIVRQTRSGDPAGRSDFLISFGGKTDGVGAFYLGKAFNLDDLSALLRKTGVSQDEADTAAQVLRAQPCYEIPNVRLRRVFLRNLGL